MAFVEDRVREGGKMMGELSARLLGVEQRLAGLEHRVTALDEKVDRRCEAIEAKIDRRFEALDIKMSRQFAWIVGVQVTILLAVVAAVLAK